MAKKTPTQLALGLALLLTGAAQAATPATPSAATPGTAAGALTGGTTTADLVKKPAIGDYIGLNYFTFFDGPGLGTGLSQTPNSLGRPADNGWSLWTNLSVRGKVSSNMGIDVQLRLQQIVTNGFEFRYQGARLGTSGTLLRIERPGYKFTWSGALNSDIPGVGQVTTERKLILNPGLFSNMSFRRTGSRFSMFALVSPRVWFYSDRDAMDGQSLRGGAVPGQKPEAAIALSPSINYDLSEKTTVRTGVGVDIRKNANADSFRRWFMPVDMGISHTISPRLSIYPHVRVSGPWDNGLRQDLTKKGAVADWTDTASVGVWLNGTIL